MYFLFQCQFLIQDYLPRQPSLTSWMRSLLIDWMVEVQESFELNHETLYLAVKLVDLYLCKKETKKDELQLLGSASLFIASKYDVCFIFIQILLYLSSPIFILSFFRSESLRCWTISCTFAMALIL